jgi:hypothetical protein
MDPDGPDAGIPAMRLLVLAGLAGLGACSPFDPCFSDRIDVTLDAVVTNGPTSSGRTFRGQVTSTNLDGPTYGRLVGALIEDTVSAAGAAWDLILASDTESGFLAFQLAADPEDGQILQLGGAFLGGGWGFESPAPPAVLLAAGIGDFTATAASGTLIVIDTRPLRLAVDLTVADGQTTYRLQGEIIFSRTVERIQCS